MDFVDEEYRGNRIEEPPALRPIDHLAYIFYTTCHRRERVEGCF